MGHNIKQDHSSLGHTYKPKLSGLDLVMSLGLGPRDDVEKKK